MKMPFELVDSHVHYWVASTPDRPWIENGPEPDKDPWPVERLLEETTAAGVSRVVDVVPSLLGYDNRYAFEAADAHPDRVAGIYGRVDPLDADMPRILADLHAHPKFMGIRLTLLSPVERSWLVDASPLQPFFEEAERLDFPVGLFARGFPGEIMRIAQQFPRTRVIVDHMALNWRNPHPFDDWPDVLAMSKLSNVYMKVSYLPEASHEEAYPYPKAKQYFREIYEEFGEDRLIWGTNFPPSKRMCSYQQQVDFMLDACSFLPDAVQAKFFGENLFKVSAQR